MVTMLKGNRCGMVIVKLSGVPNFKTKALRVLHQSSIVKSVANLLCCPSALQSADFFFIIRTRTGRLYHDRHTG